MTHLLQMPSRSITRSPTILKCNPIFNDKSYDSIVAAMLAAEDVIDPDKAVLHYLPEVADRSNC